MYYPYRIPYKGSKNKLAHTLISIMREYKPKAKYFYDLFGGGGAMSFMALQMGYNVTYNDYDADISGFVKYIKERVASGERSEYGLFPADWYRYVTREIFFEQKKEHTPYAEFCRVVYSFGNDRDSYLFSPELEKIKHLAHDIVVFRDTGALKSFNALVGTNMTLSDGRTILDRRMAYIAQILKEKRSEQLERLQQLEQLQQLQQLQQLVVYNQPYHNIEIPYADEDVIIYCDPPYTGTANYIVLFDKDVFHEWVRTHEKTIFVSEYNAPFYEIHSQEHRCTLSASNNQKVVKEKLFCNKDLNKLGQLQLF